MGGGWGLEGVGHVPQCLVVPRSACCSLTAGMAPRQSCQLMAYLHAAELVKTWLHVSSHGKQEALLFLLPSFLNRYLPKEQRM